MNNNLETNKIIQYLTLIDNISSRNSIMQEKNRPQFLFRGESKEHERILLPKYLRPLQEDSVRADRCYMAEERDIVSQFRDQAYPYVSNIEKKDLVSWRECAQHYGVPTKLLDWSSNPLVALFFSCIGDYNENGIVWMINWQNYHSSTNREDVDNKNLAKSGITVMDAIEMEAQGNPRLINPVIYSPCYTDIRMSAQSSYFMLWGTSEDDLIKQIGSEYVKEAEFVSVKTTNGSTARVKEPITLYYFIIDKNEKKRIQNQLSRWGINHKTLFPGLDGIGKYTDEINKYSGQEYIDFFFG